MAHPTAVELCSLLKIPAPIKEVVSFYLLSLGLVSPKHTQTFAGQISGMHQSQFSRLLSNHGDVAVGSMFALSRQVAREKAEGRKPLVASTPWNIGIIIDSTLHGRSSLHVQNSQRLNHGAGFVIGTQWTNVVITIENEIIPLPPISFLTKKECRRRGVPYRTEHEQVIAYLNTLELSHFVGPYDTSEVVVLMDSGYDNKNLENAILNRGWDFVGSLKSHRGAQSLNGRAKPPKRGSAWQKIRKLFNSNRRYAPWENVRTDVKAASGKRMKRKTFRVRRIEGYLKGLYQPVILICSKKSRGKGNLYLGCSNLTISTRAVVLAYTIRWRVELFHRDCKQSLGMLDAGVSQYDSLKSHVHWVYCAYLLLKKQKIDEGETGDSSIFQQQRRLTQKWEAEEYRKIIQLSTRFNGTQAVRKHCSEVLGELKLA